MELLHIVLLFCYVFNQIIAAPTDSVSLVASSTEPSPSIEGGKENVPTDTDTPEVLEIYQMHVKSNISYRFAHTTITSKVKNLAENSQEATFSIILPDHAFISGFIMEVDGKNYTAHVKEKEEAKRDYDRAVSSGLGAAHVAVSVRDSNRFTVSVNVEPATKAAFYLRYEELLKRKDGHYELLINIHPGQPVKDLNVEVLISESRKLIDVKAPPLRSGNEIGHENSELDPRADIQIINDKEAVVRFSPNLEWQKQLAHSMKTDEEKGLSAQFVVQYDVERDSTGGEVLIRDGYFVHFFAPSELESLPKHVVFVIDTSGSMSHNKIEHLKDAMHKILEQLHDKDVFSLIEFNSVVKVWDLNNETRHTLLLPNAYQRHKRESINTEIPSVYPATAEYIQKAKDSVTKFRAHGGTNINDALKVALRLVDEQANRVVDGHHQPLIMFLTDGDPTVGVVSRDIITNEIFEANSRKSPIFCLSFGLGADKTFLQKLSLKNYGFSKHIYEAADASLQLQDFYNQISSPLLADVKFTYESSVKEVTKTIFPVLYSGSEMVVAGQYDFDRPIGEAHVDCLSVKGPKILRPTINNVVSDIERLWAYLTVKQLLEKKEISALDVNDLKKKALDLALEYSFVTSVSSLVVVKPNSTSAIDTEEARASRAPSRLYPQPRSSNIIRLHDQVSHVGYNSNRFLRFGGGSLPMQNRIYGGFSYSSPNTSQGRGFTDLLSTLPWLRTVLDNDHILTLPTGNYRLGLNETITDNPICTNVFQNTTGHCTLLKACPQVHSLLINKEVYLQHFCALRTEFAGVCCPDFSLGKVSPNLRTYMLF